MTSTDVELGLTALAAMLSPTTLSFSVFALVLGERPLRTGLWFFLGAFGATILIGVLAAFVVGDAAAPSGSSENPPTAVAIIDVVFGALLLGYVIRALRRPPNPKRTADMVEKMTAVASSPAIAVVAAGATLANPGGFIPLALKDISQLDPSTAEFVVLWVGFAVIALLPLLAGADRARRLARARGTLAGRGTQLARAPCPRGRRRADRADRRGAAAQRHRRAHELGQKPRSPAPVARHDAGRDLSSLLPSSARAPSPELHRGRRPGQTPRTYRKDQTDVQLDQEGAGRRGGAGGAGPRWRCARGCRLELELLEHELLHSRGPGRAVLEDAARRYAGARHRRTRGRRDARHR